MKNMIKADTPILRIELGHGRFAYSVDDKTGEGIILFCHSDKRSSEVGNNVKLPEDEEWVSVAGIALSDYRQAEAYSEAFQELADLMRIKAAKIIATKHH